jgi:hypothetical protein
VAPELLTKHAAHRLPHPGSAFKRTGSIKDTSMVRQTMGFVLKEFLAWPTEHSSLSMGMKLPPQLPISPVK